jgi:hypothetical protein
VMVASTFCIYGPRYLHVPQRLAWKPTSPAPILTVWIELEISFAMMSFNCHENR